MLTIETRLKTITEDGKSHTSTYVIVNGIADEESFYSSYIHPSAGLYNEEVINILLNQSFKTVGEHFSKFSYHAEINNWNDWLDIDIYCNTYFHYTIPSITIQLTIEWEEWAKPWSISEFAREFKNSIESIANSNLIYYQEDELVSSGFGIEYSVNSTDSIIKIELDNVLTKIEELIEITNKQLLEKINKDSLVTYFHFPTEVRTACNQYLIYFTQFLADIGIEANTEIKEETQQTLFKVTPLNKDEALSRIREALEVYLDAPNLEIFEVQTSRFDNIAVKQWEANIYHLKSQLALANTLLQAKNATIEALQLSNYQYKQIIEAGAKQNELKEDLIKGIVTVKEYEGTGFSVNLAEILRRLKRLIK